MRLNNGEVLFAWPLAEHTITAGWYYSDGKLHRGTDLRAAMRTELNPAELGTVTWVQKWDGHSKTGNQSYGNAIKIRHADYNGCVLETLYAHLDEVCVAVGDTVTEGQVIGYTGNSGNSSGPHLHFEVRLNGTRYNPLNWLDSDFDVASDSVRLGNFISVARPTCADTEKIGSQFVIGPVSSGDAETIRALCRKLDLYTQNLVMEV